MKFKQLDRNVNYNEAASAVNVNKCLTGDTITVRIPSFVDCIDTTSWLGWRLIWLVVILQIYRLNKSSQRQKGLI